MTILRKKILRNEEILRIILEMVRVAKIYLRFNLRME